MGTYTQVERDGALAIVWLDEPGRELNTVSTAMLEEIAGVLDELEAASHLDGVVLASAKPESFVAGANIEELHGLDSVEAGSAISSNGNRLLNRLAGLDATVVAAVNGAALGAGLEIALACDYVVVADSPKTQLGLPEVQLGLLPGGGGTQRLPRRIGLRAALDMLLTGRRVYARQAKRMGLIDDLSPPENVLEHAKRAAAEGLRGGQAPLLDRVLAAIPGVRDVVIDQARKATERKTRGLYPAPPAILECVSVGLKRGLEAGLAEESKHFGRLSQTPECKALVDVFQGMQTGKHNPYQEHVQSVGTVGILGAGLMGGGIAEVSLKNGLAVVLKDLDEGQLDKARRQIERSLDRGVRRGSMTQSDRDAALARLTTTTTDDGLERAELIVEAVLEEIELKRRVLADIEQRCPEATVFASNTSALPIGDIAANAVRPAQVVGMHYFSPVPKMPLLEVIATDDTADWVKATAIDVGIRQGKSVITVGDGPGFYTSRVLSTFLNESLCLLAEGAKVETVDRAMKDWGFPVGPLTLIDEVGIDVGAHIARGVLGELFASRGIEANDAMVELEAAGYKGRKSGGGFYTYPDKGKKQVNEDIYRFFHRAGSTDNPPNEHEIQDRMALIFCNEAVRCLGEGIIGSARDGDTGAVLGLGFPPFRGGPFWYLDRRGHSDARDALAGYRERLGKRFEMAPLLEEQIASGRPFRDQPFPE